MEDPTQITPIDWDFIVETIRNEKCIIFLGPDLLSLPPAPSLEKRLEDFLQVDENPDIQTYYEHDNLFLFSSRAKKTKTYYKIKSFYSQPFPATQRLYEKLARIPIHFIINLTPDKLLPTVFDELGYRNQFAFFWKKSGSGPVLRVPTAATPTIYNMLGSIDNQESMVLTHNDLFEYFESVFSRANFPERFKKLIKEANNFIFLGIPFQRWYMQLLLRILYIHNDFDFVRYASNESIDEEIKAFCFEQFKIEFVPDQIETFIDTLLTKCEEAGLVREPSTDQAFPLASARELISDDNITESIAVFQEYLESSLDTELIDDLILIANKYKRLNKRISQGIITEEEAYVYSNRIRKELLDLINEAEQSIAF